MEWQWLELRDASGKLWGEYDPARRLLRFRRNQETPAVLFDLNEFDGRMPGLSEASGIFFKESGP